LKSQIKTAKMKLPLHEFPFVKATAPKREYTKNIKTVKRTSFGFKIDGRGL